MEAVTERALRVFLAEDNEGDIVLLRKALRHHRIEHELTVAQDGVEAIRLLQQFAGPDASPCPDVVLVDLNLPNANGHAVLAALRLLPNCEKVPVIVTTSSDALQDRSSAASLGVAGYFLKPLKFTEYLEIGAAILAVVRKERRGASCGT